jgi:lipoate---protein ligase
MIEKNMRVIIEGGLDAYHNMAVDEAIAKKSKIPTLRIYQWNPPAISIGYFQSLNQEVDVGACQKLGIDIVRRITGGGAVFHDNELTYSFVIPESAVSENIIESYNKICNGVITGLVELGIKAQFAPINDIVVGQKKISGNAQTRRYNQVLQHGTILLDVDVDKMFSILLVPNEKLKGKLIKNVKQRVTSVKAILGHEIGFNTVAHAIVRGFASEFKTKFTPGSLNEEELDETAKLTKKFMSKEWINKR